MQKLRDHIGRAPARKSDQKYLRQVLSSHPERYMRQYLRLFVPGLEFSTATHQRLARRHVAVSWPSTVRLSFLGLPERDGVRTRSIVGPARKYRQTRECFEKRGPNPAPAILIGSGVLSLSRRQ